ncbi:Aspartate--tRNA ligase [Lentibacillus sp. JNUCC-1]|uniref:aspartate--tRNA ligase n=1 Tax=Lentibacillus sp. JNUCC-1 TaxID=2654513 RepID=UPI0012E7BDEB|nr:aspartate--tRNA ligase [Lentibacillus sp. JNUCC-1]MUV39535.1 Aspartate--tRNA ligase [Lentibacillus sp. JNUCC-1]
MERRTEAGLITDQQLEQTVLLKGWVHKRRDLGGLIFIDLRDRSGLVQVVFNPANSEKALKTAETIRSEYVVQVKGKVVKRSSETVNPAMATGALEVIASDVVIINSAKTPPFLIQDKDEVSEDLRLKYRYIDLRRQQLQNTFKMRHQITQAFREYLNGEGYLEMETPILTKSTPEGARDYLVPSRVHSGEFYALPQSPQLFKQLLMMGGFERYYQIARCFRDEDLRADRQPEFTQVDIETSFMTSEEIMNMTEAMMQHVMQTVKDHDLQLPLKRLTYDEAMQRFGSDKPDTRFGMELINVSSTVADSSFKVFQSAVASGGQVSLLNVKGEAENYSRKDIDKLESFAKVYGAKGLAWLKVEGGAIKGPIAKFLDGGEIDQIVSQAEAEDGDLLLFCADKSSVVYQTLGALRLKLGKELDLIDQDRFDFLWVTDWPLLEYDDESDRYTAAHHPFTMPFEEDMDKLETDPASVRANAYDLVLNGFELGGGSLRIYKRDHQETMFKVLGFTKEEAEDQFGFLLNALEYGAPPHGGIALGLDRIVMLLSGRTNLRDTILFPKTASASDLLTDAPSEVAEAQLKELTLKVDDDSKA